MTHLDKDAPFEASPVPLTKDVDGVIRVSETSVALETIVIEFDGGASAERLMELYPDLSSEATYAVITYILSHREEVASYLARRIATRPASDTPPRTWQWLSEWGTWSIVLIVAVEVVLILIGRALGTSDTEKLWTTLAAFFGTPVGLTIGMVASPLDQEEGKQFASIASVFSAFMGGFLLSKIERLFEEAAKQGLILRASFLVPVVVFVGSGLLAAVFVWLWRKYGFR